jgi:GGDEF domain-containing protein
MPDGGVVSTHEDITEREKLKARLEQQNEQLDAAMNNMSQGLAMYDREQRLVICNEDYATMYGLTREQVRPGTTVREILEARLANGCYVTSNPHQLADKLVAQFGKVANEVHELADGRIVNVSYRQTAHGGHVITHQDITDQRRSAAKIVHMALHDALTDLPNRVLLNERLEHALTRVRRGELVAVHLLDLDHFKTVNDTLGHPTGDKLLKMVTERLRVLVRETDTIARMGGDEFAVLQTAIAQPGGCHRAGAAHHRERERALRSRRHASRDRHQRRHRRGPGRRHEPRPADPQRRPGALPRQGRRAQHLSLLRTRDGCADAGAPLHGARPAQSARGRRVRAALPARRQSSPTTRSAASRPSSVGTIPEKGPVPPNVFIPVAEEIGFIIQIGEWAIREACRAAKWPGDVRIAVNLSPIQFRNPGFVQVVAGRAWRPSGLAADRLELEITKARCCTIAMRRSRPSTSCEALGVRIAMDDFGTGYSSLSYLAELPVRQDQDRPLVREGHRRRRRLAQYRARGRRHGQRPRHDHHGRRASRPKSSSTP